VDANDRRPDRDAVMAVRAVVVVIAALLVIGLASVSALLSEGLPTRPPDGSPASTPATRPGPG
jgi:hypothetical protein